MPDFALTSTSFDPGGAIPKRFTCDGEDVSPELSWSGAPDGTAALTLIVDDPDANGFVHWIVLDMAGSSTGALAARRRRLAGRAGPGSQRIRQGRLGRAVPAVGHAPLRVHAVRDRGAARPAPASPTAREVKQGPREGRGARQGRRSTARIAAAADARPRPGSDREAARRGGRASIQARSRPIVVSRAVPGEHADAVLEVGEPSERRRRSRLGRPPGQVGPAPAAREQRVAAEQQAVVRGRGGRPSPRVWPGRVEHLQADLAEADLAALGQLDGRHGGQDLERRREQRLRVLEAVAIGGMDRDRRRRCARRRRRCPRCGPSGRGC